MYGFILLLLLSPVLTYAQGCGLLALNPLTFQLDCTGTGGGSGSVTSVGLTGTANQITVTGTSPITTSGSWTLSIPTNPTLPGTTTGTFSGNLTGNVSGTAATFTGNLTGDVTSVAMATTLANSGVVAGGCGDTTHSCGLVVDAKGRITSLSNNVIAGAGGGSGTPPYSTTTITASPMTISAATHGQGIYAFATCWDTSTPRLELACNPTRDASGNLVFTYATTIGRIDIFGTTGGQPGGSDTQIQFNDSSTFGGDSALTWNKTTDTLTIGTKVSLDGTTNGIATSSYLGGVLLSGLTGPLKLTAGVPSIALAADITGLFSGSCPSGATCFTATDGTKQVVSAFPYSYQRGSFIGIGLALSNAASVTTSPFVNTFTLTTTCATPDGVNAFQLPIGGFIRNLAGTTGIVNATSPIRWGLSPNCIGTKTVSNGPVTQTGAAAGGVVGTNVSDWWHIPQWAPLAMGFQRQGATATATPISLMSEFVSDDGLQATIIGTAYAVTPGASSTNFFGAASPLNATEANIAVPIPIAGTFKNLIVATGVLPTATSLYTLRKNGVDTALTTTVGTTDTGGVSVDTTHTVTFAAGDAMTVSLVTGVSTQSSFQFYAMAFTPTTAGDTFIWGAINAATVTTTNKYALPLSPLTGTTMAAMQATMPFACSISNLYVYQAAANGGSTVTTFTLMKNGSTTALTGTVGVGVSGSVLVDGTHSVSYAQGDLITLQFITNTGTSGAMGGWSAKCN